MTTTANKTLKDVLDDANPNSLADALAKVKLGSVLDVITEEITIASGTEIDLEADSDAGKAALMVQSVRVVTGTATGPRTVTDSGGTASATVVTLSDDGKTLTFEAAITVAHVVWIPRPDTALSTDFPTTGLG